MLNASVGPPVLKQPEPAQTCRWLITSSAIFETELLRNSTIRQFCADVTLPIKGSDLRPLFIREHELAMEHISGVTRCNETIDMLLALGQNIQWPDEAPASEPAMGIY